MKIDHKIYGFALRGTSRVLYQLKTVDCCYVLHPNNIDHYLAMLLHDQPSHVIGLGLDTGLNKNAVSEKILQLIHQQQLQSRYTFLYVPKTMKPWIASQKIDTIVREFYTSGRLTKTLLTKRFLKV